MRGIAAFQNVASAAGAITAQIAGSPYAESGEEYDASGEEFPDDEEKGADPANGTDAESSGDSSSSGDTGSSGDSGSSDSGSGSGDGGDEKKRLRLRHRKRQSSLAYTATDESGDLDPDFDIGSGANDDIPTYSNFNRINNAALSEADETEVNGTKTTNSTLDTSEGVSYTYINNGFGGYSLLGDPYGNIIAAPIGSGTLFEQEEGVITEDAAGRTLHYYPNLMAAYGVSRFRVADETHVPKDAEIVALVAVDIDGNTSTEDQYGAVDSQGNAYLFITCNFLNQATKLFLAKDTGGADTLMQDKLRYTVTGGVVEECFYSPWVKGGAFGPA